MENNDVAQNSSGIERFKIASPTVMIPLTKPMKAAINIGKMRPYLKRCLNLSIISQSSLGMTENPASPVCSPSRIDRS